MKSFFGFLSLVFLVTKLTAQSYFDVYFAQENGVIPKSIHVTNLTKGVSVTLHGTDILRLNSLSTSSESVRTGTNELTFYPNPIEEIGFFSFFNPTLGKVEIQLHSLSGKLSYQKSYELPQGEYKYEISGLSQVELCHLEILQHRM